MQLPVQGSRPNSWATYHLLYKCHAGRRAFELAERAARSGLLTQIDRLDPQASVGGDVVAGLLAAAQSASWALRAST